MGTIVCDLIRQMSLANALSGAPRIHGELLKLGIEVSKAWLRAQGLTGLFDEPAADGQIIGLRRPWPE